MSCSKYRHCQPNVKYPAIMKEKTRGTNLLTARGAEARPVLLFLYCAFSSFFKKCQPGWRAASISIFLFFLAPFFPLFSQTYLLNSALNGTTQETCTGTFYDSGGSNNKYGNNENYTVTFCSGSTARIQFSFSQFKLKNGDELTRQRFTLFRERFYGKLRTRWQEDSPQRFQ